MVFGSYLFADSTNSVAHVFDRPWALLGILLVFLVGLGLILFRKKLLLGLAKVVNGRPWILVAGGAVLTVASIITIPFMKVSTSRTALMDKENPYQKQYYAFLKEFGTPNHLIAVVEGGTQKRRHQAADELARVLESNPDKFRFVQYRVDLDAVRKQGLLYLPLKELKRLRSLLLSPKDPDSKKRVRKFLKIRGLEELLHVVDEVLRDAMQNPDATTANSTGFGTALKMVEKVLGEMVRWVKEGEQNKILVMEKIFLKRFDLEQSNLDKKGYLADRDRKRLFLFIRPKTNSDETKDLIPLVKVARRAAEKVKKKYRVTIGFTGTPAMIVDEMKTIKRDMLFMTVIALAGTILLFLAVFRSGRLMALAIVTLCTGLVWSLGFTVVAYGTLKLLTSLFFAILIGLGIDFSIHIIARFNEERGKGADPGEAIEKALVGVGPGLLTGALTTASAFYATSITEFTAFSELGIIAGTGLLLVLLASLTILPSLLILAPGPVPVLSREGTGKKRALATRLVIRWPFIVLLAAGLVTAPVLLRPHSIPFDYNITQMIPENTESREYYTKMIEESDFSSEFVNVIAGSLDNTRKLTERLKKLKTVARVESITRMLPEKQKEKLAILRTLRPVFQGVDTRYKSLEPVDVEKVDLAMESIYDRLDDALEKAKRVKRPEVPHLKKLMGILDRTRKELKSVDEQLASHRLTAFQKEMFRNLSKGLKTLKSMLNAKKVTANSLPESMTDRFVSRKNKHKFAVYVYPKRSIWNRAFLGEFVKEARKVAPKATGFPVSYYEHVKMIKSGFVEAAFLAGLAILMMLLTDFSRERYVVLGIVPMGLLTLWAYSMLGTLGASVFIAFGLVGMALFDRKSVVYTVLAFIPLSMGAAWMLGMMGLLEINYNLANIVSLPLLLGIGIVYSVHIIHRHREEHPEDMFTVVRHTGGAVTLAALTTMVGFGALITAAHGGARSVGLTMVIGVATCLLTAVVVLPALLKIVPWRFVDKEAVQRPRKEEEERGGGGKEDGGGGEEDGGGGKEDGGGGKEDGGGGKEDGGGGEEDGGGGKEDGGGGKEDGGGKEGGAKAKGDRCRSEGTATEKL